LDAELEGLWRQRVERWKQSGQSVRAYCAAEGLGEPGFYAWRRTLAERDGLVASRPRAVAVKRSDVKSIKRPPTRSTRFVPVTVLPSVTGLVEVRCLSGHVVTLPAGDAATLQMLFTALTAPAPC
jgi:hypothetical protein